MGRFGLALDGEIDEGSGDLSLFYQDGSEAGLKAQFENFIHDYDVFLCHNSDEKPAVEKIGELLIEQGILPWLDKWELRPGFPWQRVLEEQIENIKAAAVFVGPSGIGPWQQMEIEGFLREFVEREKACPVIPVILPNGAKPPKLPVFLKGMTWVDFRRTDPGPLEQLIWGITGERSLKR